jgi:phosphate transport system permease protein
MRAGLRPPPPALSPSAAAPNPWSAGSKGNAQADRVADALLRGVCALASLIAVGVLALIVYKVFDGAGEAISKFGLGFLGHEAWEPNFGKLGAATFIYSTAVVSGVTMVLSVPLAVSIGLFLSTVASGRVRAVIGPLVEMLAAIPSVILGFWGIIVFAPFMQRHIEPFLHGALGFLPFFGPGETTGLGLFTASIVVTIMVVPIIASISRDLFLTVPSDIQDGAVALGSTRWEVVRGVILPSAASGIVAASLLGLGRALGEAIATLQLTGGGNFIHGSWFGTGSTLAGRIAEQVPGAENSIQLSSLFYLGVILLAAEVAANLGAQWIVTRFEDRSTARGR